MSKLPVLSGRDLVRILEKLGFRLERQKGSHLMLVRLGPPATLSIPDHRELDRGTLRTLLRQAGLSPDDLQRML